jgi:transglutaminase-like putative cysteine protease
VEPAIAGNTYFAAFRAPDFVAFCKMGSPFLFDSQENIMRKLLLISIIVIAGCNQYGGDKSSVRDEATKTPSASGIVYRNPRVYNVDYSFELVPDPNKIDRAKDLKLWIPIPRQWESQKAVKIISVQPPPHDEYEEPEHGNRMLFWDFGKGPEKLSYRVDIKYRLESYEIHMEVDPNKIGPYDKTSEEYALYTRSTHTVSITSKIKELAREAIGDEMNPYLQAKRIFEFIRNKMRFKAHDLERGRGIKCLLNFPVIDKKTGEEYYEGACGQHSALFIALCRAVRIPARAAGGLVGWRAWIKEEDLKLFHPFELEISPDGLAAAQHYTALRFHMWTEFYVPNYGWIPVDPTWGIFGHLSSNKVIMNKGRDVKIGPHAPQKRSDGYGVAWILLNNGRADWLITGIWNIAKIRIAKAKILHHADPFPACGLAIYGENTFPKENVEKNIRHWRKEVLGRPSRFVRSSVPQRLNVEQFYSDHPRARDEREAFVCHMLRRQLGDEMFFKLVNTYVDLRQNSNQPISTSRFQKLAEDISGQSLDWFFNQWVDRIEVPQLKLEKVIVRKDKDDWQVQGRLFQLGETTFRLPIEVALDMKNGRERLKLWVESGATDFDFRTQNEPQKLIVDPDYEVLKIQKMPPRLEWFWDVYPDLLVFGTTSERQANQAAAERFNKEYLGLEDKIIKADVDVNEADLKTKCLVLFGRPETNKIAHQFKDDFPIKFNGNKFTWQGVTYDKPTQGVAQIAENPNNAQGLMMMYAGLSPEATLKFCDLYLYDADASYIIFDVDKELLRGDWEETDSDLVWKFDTHPSTQSATNEK